MYFFLLFIVSFRFANIRSFFQLEKHIIVFSPSIYTNDMIFKKKETHFIFCSRPKNKYIYTICLSEHLGFNTNIYRSDKLNLPIFSFENTRLHNYFDIQIKNTTNEEIKFTSRSSLIGIVRKFQLYHEVFRSLIQAKNQ